MLSCRGVVLGEEEAVDSTLGRGSPARQQLGQGQLLPGLELLLATMQPAEIACGLLGQRWIFKFLIRSYQENNLKLVISSKTFSFTVFLINGGRFKMESSV